MCYMSIIYIETGENGRVINARGACPYSFEFNPFIGYMYGQTNEERTERNISKKELNLSVVHAERERLEEGVGNDRDRKEVLAATGLRCGFKHHAGRERDRKEVLGLRYGFKLLLLFYIRSKGILGVENATGLRCLACL